MTVKKSNHALGTVQMPTPMGSEVVSALLTLEVAAGEVAAGDLYIMGELPEDCDLVDVVYGADDLDSNVTPTVVLDFGTINDGETDLDTTLESGLTIAQAGGAARMTPTVATMELTAPSTGGTPIGFKVATAAATGQAGTVLAMVSYRATQDS